MSSNCRSGHSCWDSLFNHGIPNRSGLPLQRYRGVDVGEPDGGGYNQRVGSVRSNEGFPLLVEVKIENGEVTDLTAIRDAAETFTWNGLRTPNTMGLQRFRTVPIK